MCIRDRDTGMGIEEKNLTEIFKRFKKLNSFIQGTGLGLSLIHILRMMSL